jgi:hypothetical protein
VGDASGIQIHFCALCNESVPQAELDDGSAVVRKGRVICARCEQSMSIQPPQPLEPVPAAPLAPVAPEPAVVAPPIPPATVLAPAPVHAAAPAQRPRSGAAVGWLALFAACGAAAWLYVRGEESSRALAQRFDQQRGELESQSRTFETALAAERERAAALASELARLQGETRESIAALKTDAGDQARTASERLEALANGLGALEQRLGEVAQSAAEVPGLRAALSEHKDHLAALSQTVETLQRSPAPAAEPGAAAASAEPAASSKPPWFGLVAGLSSANFSDRWSTVKALEETHDPAAAEYLHPLLKDQDIFVRVVVAQALGTLGSTTSVEFLIGALGDADAPVREAAYDSLRRITKRDLPFDPHQPDANERQKRIKAWQDWWKKQREGASNTMSPPFPRSAASGVARGESSP